MNCPMCDVKADLVVATHTVRPKSHPGQEVKVEGSHWVCTNGCEDEDEPKPFAWVDHEQMAASKKALDAAWEAKYGTPYPWRTVPRKERT